MSSIRAPSAVEPVSRRAGGSVPRRRPVIVTNAAIVAVVSVAIAVLVTAVILNDILVARRSPQADSAGDLWPSVVIALLLLGGGSVVVMQVARNAIGWLLLLLAMALTLQCGCDEAARVAVADTGTRAGGAVWALLSECLVRPQVTAVLLIVLLFPTGRPVSPRWRPVVGAVTAVGAASVVAHLFSPRPLQFAPFRGVAAPFGLTVLVPVTDKHVFLPLTAVLGVLAVASLALRIRRSRGVERQQLKWVGFAAAGVPVCVAWIAVASLWGTGAMNVAGDAMFYVIELAVPAAVVVAITRHRLYDLDVLVNRTIVYAALSVTLLATYVTVVLLTTRVLVSAGWRSPIVVALGTLVTTLAAAPLRRGIQDTVDRLFHRRAWAAARQIDAYARRARHVPQPPYAMRDVLREATADPTLEVAFRLRTSGRWVDGAGRPVERGAGRAEHLVSDADGAPTAALIHDPDRGRDLRLWASVVDAAALLLANGQLQAEVRAQLAEVEASRSRIIAAADAERRRVERDLHDGAQQRLLGIALQIRLAARTPAPATPQLLDALGTEVATALTELRELARGIHPAALAEGLTAALEQLTMRLPVRVDIDLPPLTAPVALTAYYVAGEAITNAVKHAGATRVAVTGTIADGRLTLRVRDDGDGGATPKPGGGLAGLTDRVAAAGGTLEIISPRGAGTTVTAVLPCGS